MMVLVLVDGTLMLMVRFCKWYVWVDGTLLLMVSFADGTGLERLGVGLNSPSLSNYLVNSVTTQ